VDLRVDLALRRRAVRILVRVHQTTAAEVLDDLATRTRSLVCREIILAKVKRRVRGTRTMAAT